MDRPTARANTLRLAGVVVIGAIGLAIGAFALHALTGISLIGIDDANIYFVYAERLTEGEGFAYTPGGAPVEGFTSLLWLLLLTPLFGFFESPETLVAALAALLSVGILGAVAWIASLLAKEDSPPWPVAAFAVAWCLACPAWIGWNVLSLMENALWGLATIVLAALCAAVITKPSRAVCATLALVASLTALVRPEAIAFTPALLFAAMLFSQRGGGKLRPFAIALAAFVLMFVLLTVLRLHFFGVPLPNTYYAKVSNSIAYNLVEGGTYLGGFVAWAPVAGLGIVAAIVLLAVAMRPQAKGDGAVAARAVFGAATIGLVLIPVAAGGDHFGSYRFFMAAWPLLGLCLGHILMELLRPRAGARIALAAAAAALVGLLLIGPDSWVRMRGGWETLRFEGGIARAGREGGAFVGELTAGCEDAPTVGLITVGGFAYSYPGPVFDLMGLTDAEMGQSEGERRGERGHAAFNADVFWSRPPEVMVFSMWVVERESQLRAPWGGDAYNEFLDGLLTSGRFREAYTPVYLTRLEGGSALQALVRRDAMDELRDCGMQIFSREDEVWLSREDG